MKKWVVILAVILIIAATALAIWQPWEKVNQTDLPLVQTQYDFQAIIIEIDGDHVLVEPLEGENERNSSDRISFSCAELEDVSASVGSVVKVTYDGMIRETYPAQIDAQQWTRLNKRAAYTAQWLDKNTAEKYDDNIFDNIIITAICTDCFFARTSAPTAYTIKLNGQLSEDWCVGDTVAVTYENTYYDEALQRAEVDLLTIEAYVPEFDPYQFTCAKPVIYLYPEEETLVSVFLDLNGDLTCTYPAYTSGWQVTAAPDGTLTDVTGQTYNYLYWEGKTNADYDLSQGFCVKGEDTARFLETALAQLGLNRKEANEFIVYWLPLMESNPYNIISFQTEAYTESARLQIIPKPDTLIRVFMAWQPAEEYRQLPSQELTAPDRAGFTVIEWGGTEIDK